MRLSRTLFFACGLLLVGCVVVAPPSPAGLYKYRSGYAAASMFIENQIRKCWVKKATFWSDGRVYKKTELKSVTLYELRRYASDISNLNPFLLIIITEEEPGIVRISVEEGDYALGSHLGLASDVERWVKGDVSCSTTKEN